MLLGCNTRGLLEHYHYQGLLKMQKYEMVNNLPDFEVISTYCHAC